MSAEIIHGDSLAVMREMPDASFDAVVTDPPYALTANKKGGSGVASLNENSPAGRARIGTGGGFMGQQWDAAIPGPDVWAEALRVAKPGARLLAFGGTRTYHRLACAIEDAGWELQDCLSWLYGSGFPKHRSRLKPAWEPIISAWNPAPRAAPLNIQACRLKGADGSGHWSGDDGSDQTSRPGFDGGFTSGGKKAAGRWPANVVLDEAAAAQLDAQTGVDVGGASRFFYCAKASRAEREAGLHGEKTLTGRSSAAAAAAARGEQYNNEDGGFNRTVQVRNHHPTVKPIALLRWLLRLVTPPQGRVLDIFAGSGTTGVAAELEGFSAVMVEQEAAYIPIIRQRVAFAQRQPSLFAIEETA